MTVYAISVAGGEWEFDIQPDGTTRVVVLSLDGEVIGRVRDGETPTGTMFRFKSEQPVGVRGRKVAGDIEIVGFTGASGTVPEKILLNLRIGASWSCWCQAVRRGASGPPG